MASKPIVIPAGDALHVAQALDDAADACSPLQAALAARLRVGAETIRMQERRLDAARVASGAVRDKLHELARSMK